MSAAKEFSQLGPDQESLHTIRPYFVLPVPVLKSTVPDAMEKARQNEDYVEAMTRLINWLGRPTTPQYTDVYVMSHGWHRNYYSAVASYDRLISRMTRLAMRRRLPAPDPYSPLFLCVHWSSEVGKDVWTDLGGRRDKPNYLTLTQQRFDENIPGFQNLMEDAFEFFSAVSAPDTVIDAVLEKKSKQIAGSFSTMRLKEETGTTADPEMVPKRIAAAWACYHESISKGVRGTQKIPPQPFAKLLLRLSLLVKFIIAAAGIGLFIGLPPVRRVASDVEGWLGNQFASLVNGMPTPYHVLNVVLAGVVAYLIIGIAATALFAISSLVSLILKGVKAKFDVGWVTGLLWLFTELAFALPLIVTLLLEYLLAFRFFHSVLFSERRKFNNRFRFSLNYELAKFARIPNGVFEKLVPIESFWASVERAIDSQLAFFEMQRRGVTSGFLAAESISKLLANPKLVGARVHLVGHSFGGLLAVNVGRELARGDQNGWGAPTPVETICTVEGAYASGWFGIEPRTIGNVQSTLATIFSEADSATGFYYPAANAGRLAAGSVGFSEIKQASPGTGPMPLAPDGAPCHWGCTLPHIHRPLPYASLADPPVLPGVAGGQSILNIDASKMVYEGAVASGGGHTDIYKDDVVLLLWAVLHRREMIRRWPYVPQTGTPTP